MITLAEAKRLAEDGNVVPIVQRVPSDLQTPLGVFMKLTSGSSRKHASLLESVAGSESIGRYSLIATHPYEIITATDGTTTIRRGKRTIKTDVPTYQLLEETFACFQPVRTEELPPFTGGGIGYFSYDTVRWLESVPTRHRRPLPMPLLQINLYDSVVCFDHFRQELVVIVNIIIDKGRQFRVQYSEAATKLRALIRQLDKPVRIPPADLRPRVARALCSRERFGQMVTRAKEYILDGDIFQVVLSRRWKLSGDADPVAMYRRLRRLNPSPYMYLLTSETCDIVGSSPEMLVRVAGRQIETRPIAGTRPRGATPEADQALETELLADAKELAEHTMLVDLGRNDLGRVAVAGSVRVPHMMTIEKYSHVMHIVSSVAGVLQEDQSALAAHAACFPAGTVTGAPKVRAMQIIDELEPHGRDLYAGTIGYLDFWGNLDSCIAIRTAFRAGGAWYLQAGAGIVADSDPERECDETESKARILMEAMGCRPR